MRCRVSNRLLLPLLLALFWKGVAGAEEPRPQERVPVVVSFSILRDFVQMVGGDRVEPSALVGNNGDVHVYTPTPADAQNVAGARLVVINGFGLEGWLPRLVQSAGSKATIVTASAGISRLESDGKIDPHGWQSVANAKIYVGNIRDALSAADPQQADAYRANAARYLAELDGLDREVREAVARIPQVRRKMISTHQAFSYFADAYGVNFVAPLGVSTESEPSARDLAAIIRQVRAERIPAVFLENAGDSRLVSRISAETGAKIGGTLYSDSLTGEKGDAPTYIAMVRHNIMALTSALAD